MVLIKEIRIESVRVNEDKPILDDLLKSHSMKLIDFLTLMGINLEETIRSEFVRGEWDKYGGNTMNVEFKAEGLMRG